MLKNLGLAAISIVFALVVSELLLRMLYEPPSRTMDGFKLTKSSSYRADPDLGWLPRPNVQGEHNRPRSFESRFSTNSLGLRDREHPFEREPGIKRIVIVGDSFTWGYGVNDGETFADLIEKMAPDVEVINLGVTAFGLRQEIIYFQRLGIKFAPDILVVSLVQNDIYELPSVSLDTTEEASVQPDGESSEPDSDTTSSLRRLKNYLGNKVVTYRIVVDALNSSPTMVNWLVRIGLKESLEGFEALDPNVGTALKEYPPVVESGWETTFQRLRELKSYTDANHVRLVLALVPALQSVDRQSLNRSLSYSVFQPTDFDVSKPYAIIEAFGAENDIQVINALPAFVSAHESGTTLFLSGDMHFNAAGHELFAKEIARHLSQ